MEPGLQLNILSGVELSKHFHDQTICTFIYFIELHNLSSIALNFQGLTHCIIFSSSKASIASLPCVVQTGRRCKLLQSAVLPYSAESSLA